MCNLAIDMSPHHCRCGALCETGKIRCRKCHTRSRWYRRKAWRVSHGHKMSIEALEREWFS